MINTHSVLRRWGLDSPEAIERLGTLGQNLLCPSDTSVLTQALVAAPADRLDYLDQWFQAAALELAATTESEDHQARVEHYYDETIETFDEDVVQAQVQARLQSRLTPLAREFPVLLADLVTVEPICLEFCWRYVLPELSARIPPSADAPAHASFWSLPLTDRPDLFKPGTDQIDMDHPALRMANGVSASTVCAINGMWSVKRQTHAQSIAKFFNGRSTQDALTGAAILPVPKIYRELYSDIIDAVQAKSAYNENFSLTTLLHIADQETEARLLGFITSHTILHDFNGPSGELSAMEDLLAPIVRRSPDLTQECFDRLKAMVDHLQTFSIDTYDARWNASALDIALERFPPSSLNEATFPEGKAILQAARTKEALSAMLAPVVASTPAPSPRRSRAL